MATLKVLQVNLCCLRERKSHGRESSKKSLVKERQKACGMKAPRKYARPTYGAPPESFAKMIRKKSVPAKAITVQSQKCGIVCESNCIDEPAGENCHAEVYRGSKTACVAQVFLHLARFHHVQPLGGMICATWRRFLQ